MAAQAVCKVVGCDKSGKITRGLCAKHYLRWQRHGDPEKSLCDRENASEPCIVSGCTGRRRAKGLCNRHYMARRLAPARLARATAHGAINDLTDADAAYIAGFLDADGTVTVSVHRDRALPLVCAFNSNEAVLEWLASIVGAGCVYRYKSGPTRPDQNAARWGAVHRYQLTGRKAQALLTRCLPFMRVKRAQAELVLRVPMRGRDYSSVLPAEHRARGLALLAEIRALNARGNVPGSTSSPT